MNSPLPVLERAPSPSQPSSPFPGPCCQYGTSGKTPLARQGRAERVQAGQPGGCRQGNRGRAEAQDHAGTWQKVSGLAAELGKWPLPSPREQTPRRSCWLQAAASLLPAQGPGDAQGGEEEEEDAAAFPFVSPEAQPR